MLDQDPPTSATVISEDSSQSLDIKTILSANPCESILATSLSFLDSINSTHSLISVPSFTCHEATAPLFLNLISKSSQDETHRITIPTSPRLKVMLMEPIVVDCWLKRLPSDSELLRDDGVPEVAEDFQTPTPWTPEGRVFPAETFASLFRPNSSTNPDAPVVEDVSETPNPEVSLSCVEVSCDEEQPGFDIHSSVGPRNEAPDSADAVPTIMLSNSIAVVALSLESSQSLAPLAVRRGHKVPAPLTLPLLKSTEDGLYPGIPTPFLGSPATSSPKFEFSSKPAVGPSLDLDSMCRDLRSRCPPLRPDFPLPPLPLKKPTSSPDTSSSSYSEPHSDDWAFAKDILKQHADSSFVLSDPLPATPSKPIPEIPDDSPETTTPEIDSYSWSNDQTLVNSPGSPEQTDNTEGSPTAVDLPKQQRRRTVIIETPRNSMIENARPARMTIDLSHLAEDDTPLSPEFDEPIPFETPRPRSNTAPAPSRPMSSASMKTPVRGILKSREKKSVRFSILPSMIEYPEEAEAESSFDADRAPGSEGKRASAKPQGRKRASSEPNSAPQGSRLKPTLGITDTTNRMSFPKHPAIRSLVRGSTPSPTPPPRTSNGRQSLPHVFAPRNVDKSEVGPPRKLLKRTTVDSPLAAMKPSKKSHANKENEGRRASAVVAKVSSIGGIPTKSRMSGPFRSIFTKFRA